ncbi:MAG: phosphatidylserine decarboxylase [Peptococcaceae bacterium]|nr:phosphatidylserine decarboxylase [Peptococcaceae bacterium]
MSKSFSAVDFAYGTVVGRCILKIIMALHLDRIAVRFLWSSWSKPLVSWYIKKNNIILTPEEDKPYSSFRDFFVRTRKPFEVDLTPEHLISPCDSLLSAFPIDEHSRFAIKSSTYQLKDFLQDESLAKNYHNGTCLIFRLCASDYHHYSYIDNGVQGENHHISGVLHSVQPIACEKYPVYVLNKRCWCLLETENFGPVVQCEIGALVVGGITNLKEKGNFRKGEEKGNFELAGSTIVLLFEKDKIELKPELQEKLKDGQEVRILQGEWIGMAK